MSNPFENKSGTFRVLINEEGQYSLWPSFLEVPAGWAVALEETSRELCLDFIRANWKDLRPISLVSQQIGLKDNRNEWAI